MKSEKIKAKIRPRSPGHHLKAASTPSTKTGNSGEFHPLDSKPSSFIDETINFWQERTGKKLSRDEAGQAISNICSFFRILSDWNRKTHEDAFSSVKDSMTEENL